MEGIARSDFYQKQLKNTEFPELANTFLCFSLIQENTGDYAGAGLSALHAAWVCDDLDYKLFINRIMNLNTETGSAGSKRWTNNEIDPSARKCRLRAISLFQKARGNGQQFDQHASGEEALLTDLARRCGNPNLALKFCDEGLQKKPEKTIADVLQFQEILISRHDITCHRISEATGESR